MRSWRFWTFYWGGWALVGVYMSSMDVAHYHIPWRPNLAANLFLFLLWGALALSVRSLLRQVPLERTGGLRSWLFHIGASLGITCASVVLVHFFFQILVHHRLPDLLGAETWRLVLLSIRTEFQSNFLVYWGAVMAFLALDARENAQKHQLLAARLETQLGQAQLQALRMQLNPHFLFNTLNAVASLIHSDPEAADQMLARLSAFLRLTLDLPPDTEHSLRQELVFVESYLAIEQIRFRDRLRIAWEVDEALLDAKVPVLLLQPLVENALHHGIAARERGGRITILARAEGRRLDLEVADDGPGCAPDRLGSGIGTANTMARLEQLFGKEQRFRLAATSQGTCVQVKIPLQWVDQGARLHPGIVS
ncbi:MAG TPA: histidine kinase [Holophagaceae bacterium]|jgi:two-component system LytT family sensor kinase|nr:histidine kinase [Holophagaceae bacterium]